MSFDLTIIAASFGWATVCVIGGYTLRGILGKNRTTLIVILSATLFAWYRHHSDFISMAEFAAARTSSLATDVTVLMQFGGPSLLLLLCLGVLGLPNVIREFVAILIPPAAFFITYFITMPLVYESVPGYRYHNIPIIWLLVFLSGITMLLLISSGPSGHRRSSRWE